MPIIPKVIRLLGGILPKGATKAAAKTAAISGTALAITSMIEPVGDLAQQITALAQALSELALAISAIIAAFGVGRKAGITPEYDNAEAQR